MVTRHSQSAQLIRRLAAPLAAVLMLSACSGGSTDEGTGSTDGTEQTSSTEAPADTNTGSEEEGDGANESGSDGDAGGETTATVAPEATDQAVAGGTLRYAIEADVDGLNPAASNLSAPGLTMANAVFDTLSATDTEGNWVPYLAESFTPNEDNTTWTVKLREGITFHDGTSLNADAVIMNFEAQRSSPLVGLAVRPFYPEENAVVKVDDLTVEFNLLEPNAVWPVQMSTQLGYMASPTWLAAVADDGTLNQAPVGTGPFVFDSRSEDSVTRFVRNDDYWNGEVYLDAVEFLPVPDFDQRNELLFGGEVQALHTTDPGAILDLRADESLTNILDDTSEETFVMLNTQAPPFDDIRAREALALATPRELYQALINLDSLRMADQRYTPDSPYYNPDVTQVGDDIEAARPLVEAYCAERGDEQNPVTGTTTCTDGKINIEYQWAGPSTVLTRVADLFTDNWGELFNVTPDELLQDSHIAHAASGLYNATLWRQFGAVDPSIDAVWIVCDTINPGLSLNWPRYCDEERDAKMWEAQSSVDPAVRVPAYQAVEKMINDAYTYVFLSHTLWDNAFDASVHGICNRVAPDGTPLVCSAAGRTWFDTIWLDGGAG